MTGFYEKRLPGVTSTREHRGEKLMNKYTTGSIIRQILIIIALAANVAIWGTVIWQEATKPAPVAGVDYFEMTNQNIEWTYAGKEARK